MELVDMKTNADVDFNGKLRNLEGRLQQPDRNKLIIAKPWDLSEQECLNKTSSKTETSVQVDNNFDKAMDLLDPKIVFHYLNRMLIFLKSDKDVLWLPNLRGSIKLFVVNIVQDLSNLMCKKFDDNCKKLCEDIISTVEVKSRIFKWGCRQEIRKKHVDLVLTKTYITHSIPDQNRGRHIISTRHSQSMLLPSTENSHTALNNDQQELPTSFKIQWLNNTLKFVKDDAQLTLQYPSMTPPQTKFILFLIGQKNADSDVGFGYKSLYAPLREALKTYSLKYEFAVYFNNTEKDDISTLLLEKMPKENKQDHVLQKRPENIMSTIHKNLPQIHKCNGDSIENGSVTANADKDTMSDIQLKKTCQSPVNPVESSKKGEIKNTLDNRKTLLMKAMSVPVTCNKAMRMMSNMGWEGGALGRSGEGITEPLIPALELHTRAGLGHVPPPKKEKVNSPKKVKKPNNPRIRVCFRKELLQHMLNLVISEETTKEIDYSTALCKNERGFLKQVLMSINLRSNMGLQEIEKGLYLSLLEEVKSRIPYVQFSVTIAEDKKHVTLTKSIVKNGQTDGSSLTKKELWQMKTEKFSYEASIHNMPTVIINPAVIKENADMILPYCQTYLTRKQLLSLAFKVTILMQVWEFLRSELDRREFHFHNMLCTKECVRIEDVVDKVNKKDRGGSTKLETDILDDIRQCDFKCIVKVDCGNKRKIMVLEKIHNQNQLPNTIDNKSVGNCKNMVKFVSHKTDNSNANSSEHNKPKIPENETLIVTLNKTVNHETANGDSNCQNSNGENWKRTINAQSSMMTDGDSTRAVDVSNNNIDPNKPESNALDPEHLEIDMDDLENYFTDDDQMQVEQDKINCKATMNKDINDRQTNKRYDFDSDDEATKYVCLVPKNYPIDRTDAAFAEQIQSYISKRLDVTKKPLPMLKCHGVKKGALVYSCHTENSYTWLESVCVASDIMMIDSKEICDESKYKLAVRVNTFIDECYTRLFSRLELYNEGLGTSEWVIQNKKRYKDCIIVVVKVKQKSFDYIRAAGFNLFAGVDVARFSIVWD